MFFKLLLDCGPQRLQAVGLWRDRHHVRKTGIQALTDVPQLVHETSGDAKLARDAKTIFFQSQIGGAGTEYLPLDGDLVAQVLSALLDEPLEFLMFRSAAACESIDRLRHGRGW